MKILGPRPLGHGPHVFYIELRLLERKLDMHL